MPNVKALYVQEKREWDDSDPSEYGYGFSNYGPMIAAFGNAVVHESDNDYQGDDYVLYYDEFLDRYGILIFGWGSCSGCDALQACSSWEDLQNLCDRLEDSIIWFEDVYTALTYFQTHDWGGDWVADRDACKAFRAASEKYLMDKVGAKEIKVTFEGDDFYSISRLLDLWKTAGAKVSQIENENSYIIQYYPKGN